MPQAAIAQALGLEDRGNESTNPDARQYSHLFCLKPTITSNLVRNNTSM